MEQKTVEIVIANRKGLGTHVETVDFVDMAALKQRLDYLVENVPFYKVTVELTPSWKPTKEEKAVLTGLEEGDEAMIPNTRNGKSNTFRTTKSRVASTKRTSNDQDVAGGNS